MGVHLPEDGQGLTCNEIIPWGDDAVLSLIFNDANGSYSIQAPNGAFLAATGALVADNSTSATHFVLEIHGGLVTFKSIDGHKYLTALGSQGLLKATKTCTTVASISDDEKFRLENSYPQITLQAANGKYISTQQGVELSAMQDKAGTDSEIFQMEPIGGDQFRLKINTSKYVNAGADGEGSAEDGVTANATDTSTDQTMGSGLLEVNKSSPDVYSLESAGGRFAVLDASGKYWTVGENGNTSATGDSAQFFYVELKQNSKLALRTESGKYLQVDAGGGFLVANGSDAKQ